MPFIIGSITAWTGDSGTLQADDGKEYNFSRNDLAKTLFSKPYEPEVGQRMIGDAKPDDASGVK
eukprot:c39780_g1_i1 orf=77-268(+)